MRTGRVIIDQRDGYVMVGPVKLFRLRGQTIEVRDKNKHRSERCGGATISAPLQELIVALQNEMDEVGGARVNPTAPKYD